MIGSTGVVTSGQARTLAELWGSTTRDAEYAGHPGRLFDPRPASLGEMISGTSRWADRTYLVQGEHRISFRRFLGAIPHAGSVLAARGVTKGERVLLLGYNTPEWVLALWGCWQVGAVPVLGNRWWGSAEIHHALDVARPALVLTDVADVGAHGLDGAAPIAQLADAYDEEPMADLESVVCGLPVLPEDAPALVIFTSGSSGSPKGVVLSYRSVVANQQNLLSRAHRLPSELDAAGPGAVTLICTPLFHIGGISVLLGNLLTGGKVVLGEGRFDPVQVLRLIEAERVQSFGGVPTMAIRVLEHPEFGAFDLSSLRSWPLGGAPVPAHLLRRLAEQLPQLGRRGLGNTWGMSEAGGFLTVAGNRELAERPGTVGRPHAVAELKIANPDPSGTGEILARSPTVMTGYLGLPDDGTVDAEGWLHTGDIGHVDGDGYLYLDGRSKEIVIRGGENIACVHVEMAIVRHPDVVEAAVFGIPHPDLGEELVAVVVHRDGAAPTPDELRAFLARSLAYFAIPTRWSIRADRLPTLAGEKPDKMSIKAQFMVATSPRSVR